LFHVRYVFTLLLHSSVVFRISLLKQKEAVKGYQPTYVFPACIKDVIRAVMAENIKDYEDPVGPNVSFVLVAL